MAIEEDPPAGVPEWVVTFGDMMSLLLCFFVLLFSMSETRSEEKFQAMASAMREQFGHNNSRRHPLPGPNPQLSSALKRFGSEQFVIQEDSENARSKKKMKGKDQHRVWTTRLGDQATLGAIVDFEEGQSELTDAQKKQLALAAEELRGKQNRIEVRGHTTARPAPEGATYKDDWELAFARCHNTMQYLVEHEGIDRFRFRLGVAGKNEPLHTAANPVLMSKNGRVEVFQLNEFAERFQEDAAGALIPLE